MQFSLIVPLWNEAKNLPALVAMLEASGLHENGMAEAVLVNNGSTDDTRRLIEGFAEEKPWIKPLHLPQNLNYGGGVYEGCRHASSDVYAYIPGDLQVSANDLAKVWETFRALSGSGGSSLLVKGVRTKREDPLHTQVVSVVYTFLANTALGLRIRDVNGLPKMFHRDLLGLLPPERAVDFVFDTQLILAARGAGWIIEEVPVTFHGRREGVSSWSNKRMNIYWSTLRQIMLMRKRGKSS